MWGNVARREQTGEQNAVIRGGKVFNILHSRATLLWLSVVWILLFASINFHFKNFISAVCIVIQHK